MSPVASPYSDMFTLDTSSLFYSEPGPTAVSPFSGARGSYPVTDCTADLKSSESAVLSGFSEVTGLVSNVFETHSQTVSSGEGDGAGFRHGSVGVNPLDRVASSSRATRSSRNGNNNSRSSRSSNCRSNGKSSQGTSSVSGDTVSPAAVLPRALAAQSAHGSARWNKRVAKAFNSGSTTSVDLRSADLRSGELRSVDLRSTDSVRSNSSKKGQGYRKLWEQVTKVTRGQKLGDGSSAAFSDMTVEDLLKIISSLSPNENAVEAVSQGLYYLDSSACAALLKELCRQGMSKRAVELFDWLRTLDNSNELSNLCDVYTYTTMVSQCGSHQQLRRALELVAEMRSRGIKCNVRTFTALMNVCIKANEVDLALDVYGQMMMEGCTPNLVTYNTLIDIYGKTGQWAKAIEVLDTLDRQNIQPEVRTYNTVISACNRSSQPEQALRVYERMLAKDVKPSATTYTALISAYGKKGQVDKALEIFHDMVHRGCERNVITYSSLIGACEKAGRWELAIDLFNKMHRENCKPNVVTYNSLIATCAIGGHWAKACEVFDHMVAHGCRPDSTTYSAVISALTQGGSWIRAVRVFEEMQNQGCRPDAVVYNALLDVLWQSGVTSAQAKAVQLWRRAVHRGIICFNMLTGRDAGVPSCVQKPDPKDVEYSTVVFTVGAAVISVLRWLIDLRNRISVEGVDALHEEVSLVLQRGKHNIAEQAAQLIRDAVASVLDASKSPFRVTIEDQQNVRLAASTAELATWLQSCDFHNCISQVTDQSISGKRGSSEALCAEDASLESQCAEAFAAVRAFEETHKMDAASRHYSLLNDLRTHVVSYALGYGSSFGFKDETVQDALLLFDRVVASGVDFQLDQLQLILCACLLLMGRLCEPAERIHSLLPGLPAITGFDTQLVVTTERQIRSALGEDVGAISTLRIVHLYLERLGCLATPGWYAEQLTAEIHSLVVQVSCAPVFMKFSPSVVAAAVLLCVRKSQAAFPYWPSTLSAMTGYSMEHTPGFALCVQLIDGLLASRRSVTNETNDSNMVSEPLATGSNNSSSSSSSSSNSSNSSTMSLT